jgi:K+-transporting ATPase ATPase A chain
MTLAGWLQIILVFAIVVAAAWPLGIGMARLFSRTEPTALERGIYRVAGIDATKEQSWAAYTLAMLAINFIGFVVLYLLQRVQFYLPFDPQGFTGTSEHLAFNTAISFVSNTNWQSYGGETTMSHFVQMAGLTVQNFLSAATGIALAVAVTRAFARTEAKTLGNFWVDLTRSTVYVLLPLAIIVALAFAALGMPQTLQGSVEATTLEGAKQVIALGPVASQEAIKQLGTNGGGFFNANSAHPFENPSAWTNYLSIFAMLVVSAAMPVMFGRTVGDMRQGRALLIAMLVMLAAGAGAVYWAEAYGNPLLSQFGFTSPANFEGKEVRFGLAMSALSDTARRPRADVPDPARRDPARRRRLGPLWHHRHGADQCVCRWPDGRPHTRLSRQEDRGQGDEARGARDPRPAARHPGLHRHFGHAACCAVESRQCRPAWPLRDPLCLLIRGGQ